MFTVRSSSKLLDIPGSKSYTCDTEKVDRYIILNTWKMFCNIIETNKAKGNSDVTY